MGEFPGGAAANENRRRNREKFSVRQIFRGRPPAVIQRGPIRGGSRNRERVLAVHSPSFPAIGRISGF